MLSVVQAGLCITSNQLDFDEEVAFQAVRKIYDLARREEQRPFFLLASFTHPHDPFAITPEYWHRYNHNEIDMPVVPPIPYEDLDPHSRRLYHVCAVNDYAQTNERIRNARHAYYGMISYIDDKVGQLVRALQNSGLASNTVLIFLSDHGEMLGERGLWYKMSFFEGSARIPLLLHAPGRFAANRVAQPVSLLDLLPTLVELADNGRSTPTYATPLDGHSLLPHLHDSQTKDNHPVYGELLGEGAIAPLLMVRDGRYKYIYSPPDPEQLYDLESDPQELNNLAGQPQITNIRQSFYDQVLARWDISRLHEQVLASQRRRRLVDKALRHGRYTSWDFQPFDDASQKYMRNHLDLNVLERTARYPAPAAPEQDGRLNNPTNEETHDY
jgi:choline-sulfatase